MYTREDVVKGPDIFGDRSRPYLCLSDDTHPFSNEEALYTIITTKRKIAIPLSKNDFVSGGLPRQRLCTSMGPSQYSNTQT